MEPSSQTVGQTPLDAFVELIPSIYSAHDVKRDITDVWAHANHYAAAIGEEVRKSKPGSKLLEEIADFSMWLFTLLGKLQGPLGEPRHDELPRHSLLRIGTSYSDLLWNKYPRICPVCYWRRVRGNREAETSGNVQAPCDCLLYDVEHREQSEKEAHVTALRAYAAENVKAKPASVNEWQEMFGRIFAANQRHLELPQIAFHLLEEMGEVSDAMVRMYTYNEDKKEFVDDAVYWRLSLARGRACGRVLVAVRVS